MHRRRSTGRRTEIETVLLVARDRARGGLGGVSAAYGLAGRRRSNDTVDAGDDGSRGRRAAGTVASVPVAAVPVAIPVAVVPAVAVVGGPCGLLGIRGECEREEAERDGHGDQTKRPTTDHGLSPELDRAGAGSGRTVCAPAGMCLAASLWWNSRRRRSKRCRA